MSIGLESPDQPALIALIVEPDACQESLCPPESRHPLDIAALTQANVLFAVARDVAGCATGCGAVALPPGFGEIKRMYVHPQHRGQSIAASLLGCPLLKLETEPLQPEALALYARSGYVRGHSVNTQPTRSACPCTSALARLHRRAEERGARPGAARPTSPPPAPRARTRSARSHALRFSSSRPTPYAASSERCARPSRRCWRCRRSLHRS
jgi:putative acetyltransferase